MTPERGLPQNANQLGAVNPRIVTFDAAEPRLPAFARPIFRAAAFPGYVLLDE